MVNDSGRGYDGFIMIFQMQFAADTIPALVMGAVLFCAASAMALKQWWAHRRLVLNPKVDEASYQHTERQIHRRLFISGLMFLLSVLIPMGDQLGVFFLQRAEWFFAFWMGVLLIVFMMVILALVDLLATVAYARLGRAELGMERRAIEEEIRRYRASRNQAASQNPENN